MYYGLGTRRVLGFFRRGDFDLGIFYPSLFQNVEESLQAGYGKLLKRQVGDAVEGRSLYSGWMCQLRLPCPGWSRLYTLLSWDA